MAELTGTTTPPNVVEPRRENGKDLGKRRERGQDKVQKDTKDQGEESRGEVRRSGQCLPKSSIMPKINI
jgi:hypothetical protein